MPQHVLTEHVLDNDINNKSRDRNSNNNNKYIKSYRDIPKMMSELYKILRHRRVSYLSDFHRPIKQALSNCNTAIFDLDDTLIDSITNRPNLAVIKLYNFVRKKMGWSIYIITARIDVPDVRQYTTQQLRRCGIVGYSHLFMRPVEMMFNDNFSAYKHLVRLKLCMKQGCRIGLNVGDSFYDLLLMPPYQYKPQITRMHDYQSSIINNLVHNNKAVAIFYLLDLSVLSVKLPQK